MNRTFYGGLAVGALLAGGAFLLREHCRASPGSVGAEHVSKGDQDEPQYWLLPKDSSITDIYREPAALFVLDAPKSVTVHQAGTGTLRLFGHSFVDRGYSPSPQDVEILQATFQSLNAYTAVSACKFDPGVLVRLRRGGETLDLLVCFSCSDLGWAVDGLTTRVPQVGLSDIGLGTLRAVFHRLFPNDPEFDPL